MDGVRRAWWRRSVGAALAAGCLVPSACFLFPGAEDGDGDTDTDTDTATESTGGGPGTTGGSTPDESGGGTAMPWEQTAACAAWLECVPLSRLVDLEPVYGPTGTCWQSTASMVESCDTVCVGGFNEDCDGPPPDDDDDPTMGNTTGPELEECSFEALAPDATSWVEAGEEEGMIPSEIGVILESYCSCHLTEVEEFDVLTPLYYGTLRFHTLEEFQSSFGGAPTHREVKRRVFDTLSMPPLYYCGDGDYGSSVHTPDYEVFEAWLLADAPDAPSWAEMQ